MKRITKLAVVAAALVCLTSVATAPVMAAESSAEMFSCMHEGTKVSKTYVRHADPAKLAEAVAIFEGNVEGKPYPVGTVLQMVPNEAMVKHEVSAYPNSGGWEFLIFDVSAEETKITGRGDSAANPLGTCLSCHTGAAKFDYVCSKGHGCPPVPVTDEQIIAMQGQDPRCSAN